MNSITYHSSLQIVCKIQRLLLRQDLTDTVMLASVMYDVTIKWHESDDGIY